MEIKRKNKGITLIALVVTIIVLLLLAGISISMITGEGGILGQAKDAGDITRREYVIELAQLDVLQEQTSNQGRITEEKFKDILAKHFDYDPKTELPENLEDLTLSTKDGKFKDIKVSEVYNGTLSDRKKNGRGITAEKIYANRAEYYGKYVDYPIDINGDGKTERDWKIFYIEDYKGEEGGSEYYNTQQTNKPKNGKRIFLIATDYVGNKCDALTNKDTGALKKSGMTESTSYKCTYYWNSPSSYAYDCTLPRNATGDKEACEFPSLFEFTGYDIEGHKENPNSLLASALLCTGNWQSFVNDTYADFAIGGPTVEMWCDSWNELNSQKVYTSGNTSKGMGYGMGYNDKGCEELNFKVPDFNSDLFRTSVNKLYFPHPTDNTDSIIEEDLNNDGIKETCWGYWMGSPYWYSSNDLVYVLNKGSIMGDRYSHIGRSLRPVICLKSDVQLELQGNGEEDSYYKLVNNDE